MLGRLCSEVLSSRQPIMLIQNMQCGGGEIHGPTAYRPILVTQVSSPTAAAAKRPLRVQGCSFAEAMDELSGARMLFHNEIIRSEIAKQASPWSRLHNVAVALKNVHTPSQRRVTKQKHGLLQSFSAASLPDFKNSSEHRLGWTRLARGPTRLGSTLPRTTACSPHHYTSLNMNYAASMRKATMVTKSPVHRRAQSLLVPAVVLKKVSSASSQKFVVQNCRKQQYVRDRNDMNSN